MKTADAPSLPHSIDAEQAVLGSLLLRQDSLPEVADWLSADDFYRADHRLIFEAITALAAKGQPFDWLTLGELFDANGTSERIGGSAYLIELASASAGSAMLIPHAEIVTEKARQRMLIEVGTKLANPERGQSAAEMAALAQEAITELAPARRTGLQHVKPLLLDWFRDLQSRWEAQRMPGLPWPWMELNTLTHGLQDGEVTVLAARPGTGKSALAFQASAFTALRGGQVAIFSLEMNTRQVMRRCVSGLGDIPHDWLIEPTDSGESDRYWSAINGAIRELCKAPLHVDDSPALSSHEIRARARRLHLQSPIRLLVVDHLHEMRVPGKQGETIERGQAARDIKALAKELGCPCLLLAQLNRGSEAENRRPTMRDLRAAGGIEEMADVVLFPWRDNDEDEFIEIVVGKGRDLKKGKPIFLRDRFDVMRAEDWDGPRPQRVVPIKAQRGFRSGVGRDRAAGEQ